MPKYTKELVSTYSVSEHENVKPLIPWPTTGLIPEPHASISHLYMLRS